MELKLVTNTARSAVLELTESGKFYTESQYDIYVNDEKYMESNKVITSLFDLKPDTDYNVYAVYNGQKTNEVNIHTKYEFVTLNVRDLVHWAMVCMMIQMQSSVQLWHALRFKSPCSGR